MVEKNSDLISFYLNLFLINPLHLITLHTTSTNPQFWLLIVVSATKDHFKKSFAPQLVY